MKQRKFKHKQTGIEVQAINHGEFYKGIQYYTTVIKPFNTSIPEELLVNSNDWEEIVEKDYEILSYKGNLKTNQGYFKKCFGGYTYVTLEGEEVWKNNNVSPIEDLDPFIASIYSVKRVSDKEIFTIGDKVKQSNVIHNNTFTITGFVFDVNNEHLLAVGNGGIKISKIEKVKPVLFTTEDGVEVREGDHPWLIDNKSNKPYQWSNGEGQGITNLCSKYNKYFSTKEKALEYIYLNTPCLSIKEIAPLVGRANMGPYIDLELLTKNLKYLVKSKIE